MSKKDTAPGEVLICRNPKALMRFEVSERLEAGIILVGSEVKSLRAKRADMEGAFATFVGNEAFLHHTYIAPYEQAGQFGHETRRTRKLLLNTREIEKWRGRTTLRGETVVALRIYFKGRHVKVELGLARGKKQGDDREKVKREVDLAEARAAMQKGRRT